MKGGVLQKVKTIEDILSEFKIINKTDTTAVNAKLTDFLIALQNDIIYTLDPAGNKALGTVVGDNLDLIKEFNAFNGLHADPARASILTSRYPHLPKEIKELLKEGEDATSDNFEEIFITTNDSVDVIKQKAEKKIRDRIAIILTELEDGTSTSDYFEQEPAAFLYRGKDDPNFDSKNNPQDGDPVFNKKGQPIAPPTIDGTEYNKILNKEVVYLYSYINGVDTVYTLVKINLNVSANPSSITSLPNIDIYKPEAYIAPTDPAVYAVTMKVIQGNVQLPISFLEKSKQTLSSTRINLEWEHIVALATYNIYLAAMQAKNISLMKVEGGHPEITKAARMFVVLERLFNFAMKVDSLFTSFTDDTGKLISGTTDPLTRAAILSILKDSTIDYTEYNWVTQDSATGKLVAKPRPGYAKRTTTITLEGLNVEYKDFLVNGRVGLWGTMESNQAKGTLSNTFIGIAKLILQGKIEEAMTKLEALEGKAEKSGSDSFAKSLAISSGLHNLGVKADPAKAKTHTTKMPKVNISTPTGKSGSLKPVVVRKPKNTVKNKTTKRSSKFDVTDRSPSKEQVPTARSESLVALINYSLSSEVKKLMTGGPRLQNRTGRLADSAKVTSASSKRILVEYMSNPYDVFSKDRGASPWNSLNRDPVDLISLAVRNILAKNNKRYARSVSIGRV